MENCAAYPEEREEKDFVDSDFDFKAVIYCAKCREKNLQSQL